MKDSRKNVYCAPALSTETLNPVRIFCSSVFSSSDITISDIEENTEYSETDWI